MLELDQFRLKSIGEILELYRASKRFKINQLKYNVISALEVLLHAEIIHKHIKHNLFGTAEDQYCYYAFCVKCKKMVFSIK